MWRCVCALVVLAGCWSDDPSVNGLTPEQWAHFQAEFTVPALTSCAQPSCDRLAMLGKLLFADKTFSSNGKVACVTCHDPGKAFIDSRTPNNVSLGAITWTGRNSIATMNLGLKYQLEGTDKMFTWSGRYDSPGKVLELAINGPFDTDVTTVEADAIARYGSAYGDILGASSGSNVLAGMEKALDAYLFRITSVDSPFDQWLAGSDDAISDSAKRGFVVFVGRGTCVECHSGPLFSDFDFHDTGVPQQGSNVPLTDLGRSTVTHLVDDDGKFQTPSLRNVALTGRYMHDGFYDSLPAVVDFYRRGGDDGPYAGVKDPRITPLDLTDDDAHDLVEFLNALTDPSSTLACKQLTACSGTCTNTLVDFNHCGSCDSACMPTTACVMGSCVPAGPCMPPDAQCGTQCVNLETDRHNCGACGRTCAGTCTAGLCE